MLSIFALKKTGLFYYPIKTNFRIWGVIQYGACSTIFDYVYHPHCRQCFMSYLHHDHDRKLNKNRQHPCIVIITIIIIVVVVIFIVEVYYYRFRQ